LSRSALVFAALLCATPAGGSPLPLAAAAVAAAGVASSTLLVQEVWVPPLEHLGDLRLIIAAKAADVAARAGLAALPPAGGGGAHPLAPFVAPLLSFVAWFDGLEGAGAHARGDTTRRRVVFTTRTTKTTAQRADTRHTSAHTVCIPRLTAPAG
jgi:hypothetical protein